MKKNKITNCHSEEALATEESFNRFFAFAQNDGESGRSMVEMLGVLAVIGVLSVAGIAGYTSAMNKHRANELLNEASKRAVVVVPQIAMGNTPSIGEFTNPSDHTFAITGPDGTSAWKNTDKQFSITISGVSEAVCQQMKSASGGIVKGFKPETCADNATVILTYNNDMSTGDNIVEPSITCPDGGKAEKGVCCQYGFQYNENSQYYDILNPEACGCPSGGEVSPKDSSVCCRDGAAYYPEGGLYNSDGYTGVNLYACGCSSQYFESIMIYYKGQYGCRACMGTGSNFTGYYQLENEYPFWSFGTEVDDPGICSGVYDVSGYGQ